MPKLTTSTIEALANPTNKDITIKVEAESGRYYWYEEDGNVNAFDPANGFTVDTNKTVLIWSSSDANDSEAGRSETLAVKVDNISKQAPVIYLASAVSGVRIIDNVTSADKVSVQGESEAGIKSIIYTIDGSRESYINDESAMFTQRGTYTVKVVDVNGNKSETITFTLVDKAGINTVPSVANGQKVATPVTVSSEGTLVINGVAAQGATTLTESKDYSVVATDIYGSQSTLTFTIDAKLNPAPIINKVVNEDGSTTIKVTIPDGVTGDIKYKVDEDGMVKDYPQDGITATEDSTIYVWYVDENGNESAQVTVTVDGIDKVSPEYSITSNEYGVAIKDNKTSASSVTVTATDNSGNAKLSYSINGSDTVNVDMAQVVISSRGKYEFTARDEANNTVSFSIELVEKPVLTTSPKMTNGQETTKPVVASASEGATLVVDGMEVTSGATISDNGRHTVAAKDVYGSEDSVTFTIDNTKHEEPTLSPETTRLAPNLR